MRIIQFTVGAYHPTKADGTKQTIYHLSRNLAALGHDVAVFAIDDDPATSPIKGVEVRNFPSTRFKYGLSDELQEALREWQPDIVHLHSSYNIASAGVAHWLQRNQIPYTVTTHGNLNKYLLRRRWYVKYPYKYLVQLPYFNEAEFIHEVGDIADCHQYGVTVPVECVPNGINVNIQRVDEALFLDRFPQLKDKRLYLFIGRLDPYQKGLEYAIRAFAKADLPDSRLALVGPDHKGSLSTLMTLVDTLGMTEQIIFTGPLYDEDKLSALAAADVFVHTSLWEGHSFSILEAMANGVPCLVTTGADPQGMVVDGESGYRATGLTVEEITTQFKKVAQATDEELALMGQNARRIVEQNYTWKDVTCEMIRLYKKYLHQPAERHATDQTELA
ncbi:glycosyltransferase [Phototrophicus methaneseepsis]|uniref:Glycosyltransferase n=1 Tax=Phototrophicus methaneseepsis TaxID=2710758 RepID=A0A7S8E9M0_9CHLR|nr:glycosyltransferase [Phototrophicus methaneseepsis]QPC82929.1 glycosyltransferase [Phototrophicus methaneseepsis]